MRITRREFLRKAGVALGAAAYVVSDPGEAVQASNEPTNVLILMSDEHNPRYSSVYLCPGYPDFLHTPNMQELARRGVVFEHAYCPAPLCMPSRSSFMSGLRNHEVQAYSNCSVYQERYNNPLYRGWVFPTYGQVLAQAGVYTAYIGKMDTYCHSDRSGFCELISPGNRRPPGDCNIQRRPVAVRAGAHYVATEYGPRENACARDAELVEKAVNWITTKGRSLNAHGVSWTLTVNVVSPHFPHTCLPEDWALYPMNDMPRYGREQQSAQHPFVADHHLHFEEDHPDWTPENIAGNRRGYYGKVTFVDRMLGKLISALDRSGLSRRTVLVYTSDHGEMLGKFGMWRKCTLYEDAAAVPLIVAGPGFKPGTRVRTPVDLLDLNATIFRALGLDRVRPRSWKGTPLQEIKRDDPDRVVFAEYHGHGKRASHFMIRKDNWKLIYYIDAPHQLFDLENDPNELVNLVDKYPDKFRELERDLRNICSPEEENARAERMIRAQLALIRKNYPNALNAPAE
ncbi:MAG: sulfatase-like hydrolase/transferase [Armatimonadota bacterium]|nr:sulfatase-like hydrolase/transferase [Armatimonadota bacterium]